MMTVMMRPAIGIHRIASLLNGAKRVKLVRMKAIRVHQFGDPLPVIETVLIDRPDEAQMGAGETTITIVAAALANAIFDATGARVREAPMTEDRVLAALKARA